MHGSLLLIRCHGDNSQSKDKKTTTRAQWQREAAKKKMEQRRVIHGRRQRAERQTKSELSALTGIFLQRTNGWLGENGIPTNTISSIQRSVNENILHLKQVTVAIYTDNNTT